MTTIKIVKCRPIDPHETVKPWYCKIIGEIVEVDEFKDWGSGQYYYAPLYEGIIHKDDTVKVISNAHRRNKRKR